MLFIRRGEDEIRGVCKVEANSRGLQVDKSKFGGVDRVVNCACGDYKDPDIQGLWLYADVQD